jgi:two-component system OmpR family response regulator
MPPNASHTDRHGYGDKILIVDDDKGIRTVVSEFLGKHGYLTATAANPIEMRKILENGAFDLIVLDVMMPKEDGLSALRSLGRTRRR